MNLKSLPEQLLIEEFEKLIRVERKITHHILQHIAEIDRRKLYLAKAYSSLYQYLTEGFGYSAAAAMRRIDGARLMIEIPELAEKIEQGTVHLSHVSQLQRAAREVKKNERRIVSPDEKRQVLAKIEQTSQKQSEQIIAESFSLPLPSRNKTVVHKNASTTLTITLSKKQQEILDQAKSLISHSVPFGSWADVITYLADKEIKRRLGKDYQATSVAEVVTR